VAIAMYFVADWFAKPVRLLGDSMKEIAKGRFDHRIREMRKDEFGQLYLEFDAMAEALQTRHAQQTGDSRWPGRDTTSPSTLGSASPPTADPKPPTT